MSEAPRRWRLGLRRETLILLPAAIVLLVVISTFTLLAYRSSITRLVEARQAEAMRQARQVAERLARTGEDIGGLPAGALAVTLLDAAGETLAAAGDAPAQPLAPLRGQSARRPVGIGPDDLLPDRVAGFASWDTLQGRRTVRVDLEAALLGASLRSVRLLTLVVVSVDGALVLLVLLFLRHLLRPWELMLERARQLGGGAAGDDEVDFLLSAFERALGALSAPEPSAENDFAALERTLSSSLQSGLLLLDREGRVLALNAVGAQLLGQEIPEPGRPLHEALAGQPQLLEILTGAVAEEHAPRRQECNVRSGGATLTLGLTVHPLRRDDGEMRGYLVLFADLTEVRRRTEEIRLADHLARLGEMAGGIAHELRNSLATLRGYLTLIERRPDEGSVVDYLSEIRHEADHLERVLDDFVSFARPGTTRFQEVPLARLARRVATDPALEGFAVEVLGPPGELCVRGDYQLLERALRNLLRNAAQAERAAGREGPVLLRIERAQDGVEIAVEDRGDGVPAQIRDRLFHPFATGRRGGVGLGLALTHRIVVLHGGRIRLEDRPDGGTRAVLSLPADTIVTEGPNPARQNTAGSPANVSPN